MILFFDCETDGLPDYALPPDHERQPQLIQLAMILTEEDGTERANASMIVQPTLRPIPDSAAAVHGITTEIANRAGVWPTVPLALWDRLAFMADVVVAHNVKFNRAIIHTGCERFPKFTAGTPRDFEGRHGQRQYFCTMEAAAPIVNLPPTERMIAASINKPKAPKLEECVQFFFNEKLEGAHNALVDVRACARIYFEIKKRLEA